MKIRAAVLAGLVMLLALFLTYSIILVLFQQDREATALQGATETAHTTSLLAREGDLRNPMPAPPGSLQAWVLDADGQTVAVTAGLVGKPLPTVESPTSFDSPEERTVCPDPLDAEACLVASVVKVHAPSGPLTVVATDVMPTFFPASEVTVMFALLALFFVLAAGVGTWYTARLALLPVDNITRRLDVITATNLDSRVPVPRSSDEVHHLATSVNATLDRLETAVESQRNFVADASHELKTPVAALQSMAEVAVLYPTKVDLYRSMKIVLADAQKMNSMITDLLMLARLDAYTPNVNMPCNPVDLTQVVRDELAHHERSVPIDTILEDVSVLGSRLHLGRLLVNLLDNAERHARQRVEVRLTTEDGYVVLEVGDDGDGVAPEDRDRIFQRFTRLDSARKLDASGSGLGLALAGEIATAHHGTLTVADSSGGTPGASFVLRLPSEKTARAFLETWELNWKSPASAPRAVQLDGSGEIEGE